MTLAEAQRILTDHRFLRDLMQQAINQLAREVLERDFAVDDLAERRGIVKGIRMVENILAQAEAVLREAEREEQARREAAAEPVPALIQARHYAVTE